MKIINLFIIIVFSLIFINVYAAPAPPPLPGQIPLDPMSWILLSAGGAIGAKKYYDSRKKSKPE